MTILCILLIAYFALMIGIGIYGKRYSKDFHSSVNMGKKGGVILLAGACVGASIGNGFVVGGAGKASVAGLAGSAFGLGCAAAMLVVAFVLSDFIYKHGYISPAAYTMERYNSNLPGIIYILTTCIGTFGFVGTQLITARILFEMFGLDVKLFTILTALVIFSYSELAGVWGAYATSVVQTVIIIVGMLLLTIVILTNGGYSTIQEGIASGVAPSGALDFSGLGLMGFLSVSTPVLLSTFTSQGSYVRINSANSARTSKIAHIIGAFALVPLAIIPAFIGVYGAVKYGITGDEVFFAVVFNELHPVAAAVIVVTIIAVIMSTIDVCYSSVDTIIICDLLENMLNKDYTEKKLKVIAFSVNVIMTVSAVIMSLNAGSILDFMNQFFSFINAACLVPLVGGILMKKAPTIAATSSSLAGVACVVLGWCGVPVPSVGGFFPCIISAIVFIVFTLLDKNTEFGKL